MRKIVDKWLEGEKCPICGKIFIPAPMHVYEIKKKNQFFKVCSYSCARKAEKIKKQTQRRYNCIL